MTPMHDAATPMRAAAIHTDVARLLANAQSALARDPGAALRYIARASDLLTRPGEQAPTHGTGSLAPWQAKRVKAYIAANLADPISIDDLAAEVGLSASYFSRAFRATFGEAPYVHVLRRRVEHGCDLMLATDDPLSQIAIDCGLADQSHFTRLFRRFLGTTPHAWRRARQEKAPLLA